MNLTFKVNIPYFNLFHVHMPALHSAVKYLKDTQRLKQKPKLWAVPTAHDPHWVLPQPSASFQICSTLKDTKILPDCFVVL